MMVAFLVTMVCLLPFHEKVLNVERKSKYYKDCMQIKKKRSLSKCIMVKLACKFNCVGTTGGIKTEVAKSVLTRSIDKHGLRYVEYLRDGNSKRYINIKNLYVGIEIKRLECVGHYQKRVGTRLCNLNKKVEKFDFRGRLTDATIDCLKNFLRVAIRHSKGSSKKMKSNLLASLIHVAPSNNNKIHICKYNTKTHASVMHINPKYKIGPRLPKEIIYKVRPVYLLIKHII